MYSILLHKSGVLIKVTMQSFNNLCSVYIIGTGHEQMLQHLNAQSFL